MDEEETSEVDAILDEHREVAERPSARIRRRELRCWTEKAGAWLLRATSYRLGERFVCEVDRFDTVETVGRAEGTDRRSVEREAMDEARTAARAAGAG